MFKLFAKKEEGNNMSKEITAKEEKSSISWSTILRIVREKKSQQRTAVRNKVYHELEDLLKVLADTESLDTRKLRNALDRFTDRMMGLTSSSR